jgi:hypothetical protein
MAGGSGSGLIFYLLTDYVTNQERGCKAKAAKFITLYRQSLLRMGFAAGFHWVVESKSFFKGGKI